jgi:hypothetical protein
LNVPRAAALALAAALVAGGAGAQPSSPAASPPAAGAPALSLQIGADDIARPKDLPEMGKWMYDPTGVPAHWLGEIYEGKRLREPINLIVLDRAASSPDDAVVRLSRAAADAGCPSRFGHSSGYQAMVGGETFGQIERGREHAFSDEVFVLTNDHGRIFGPYRFDGGYLFIGAFSRERVYPLERPGHRYASFNEARDRFSQSLDAKTPYKVKAFVPLDNALIADPEITTGDHDGIAVLLEAP